MLITHSSRRIAGAHVRPTTVLRLMAFTTKWHCRNRSGRGGVHRILLVHAQRWRHNYQAAVVNEVVIGYWVSMRLLLRGQFGYENQRGCVMTGSTVADCRKCCLDVAANQYGLLCDNLKKIDFVQSSNNILVWVSEKSIISIKEAEAVK